jgi:hypothetical protein
MSTDFPYDIFYDFRNGDPGVDGVHHAMNLS